MAREPTPDLIDEHPPVIFVDNDDFRTASSGQLLQEIELPDVNSDAVLTFEQEQHLFRQMNYLRFLAEEARLASHADQYHAYLSAANSREEYLCNKNLGLINSVLTRFTQQLNDDLRGELQIKLIRAIRTFDYARGYRLSTYAYRIMTRDIWRYVKRDNRRTERYLVTGPDLMSHAPSSPHSLRHEIVDKTMSLVQPLLDDETILDARERTILQLRFGLNGKPPASLREAGKVFGISKERVRQIQVAALEKVESACYNQKIVFQSPQL